MVGSGARSPAVPRPVSNPPNPWHSRWVEWLDEPPPARLEVFEERAKSALVENESRIRQATRSIKQFLRGQPIHQHEGSPAPSTAERVSPSR